ncbi:uncharacterized protein RB166_019257 [Leptodactylus fuscus]|uniref:uncharacterized protein LOC142219249 n=1 Tax=Leptodactylus fuscus TaxID=238119 RepID=UPI003F4EDB44
MGLAQHLQQIFSLKTLGLILGLLGRRSLSGKLQIYKVPSPIEELLGQDVTVPCRFYGYEDPHLNISTVAARWTLTTPEGEKLVYLFDGGRKSITRSGSSIAEDGLAAGDASLYLPSLGFSDEGEYTCHVIVTPDKAVSKVTLQVSATPACTVSDPRLELTPGAERSLTCYVDGFHPEDVKIHWLKYSKTSTNNVDGQSCTTVPVQNQDQTYNVTSVLSVRPRSLGEDGDVYSCLITHRSLRHGRTCNTSLSVRPMEDHRTYALAWTIVGIVLTLAVFILVAFILYHCVKVSPFVWDITGEDLFHMKENTLKCHISYFRPKCLTIKLYLENGTENKTEMDSWSSESPRYLSRADNDEETLPLRTRDDLRLGADITPYKYFLYNCVCSIRIRPQFQLHNGAVLSLEIHHAALKSPVHRYQILKVSSAPEVEAIEPNQEAYRAGDVMELRCRIHSFYPKNIEVLWYKDTEEVSTPRTEATESQNRLYYLTSSVRRRITEDDCEKTFRCKVKHQWKASTFVQWRLEKLEPILDPIQPNQESYNVGDKLELRCRIHSFYPRDIKVTWCKEGEEILSQTSEHEVDERLASSFWGYLSYIVTNGDFGKIFTCNVEHSCQNYSVRWKLERENS